MSDIAKAFSDAYPRAIDFLKTEYDADQAAFDAAAAEAGYRLAGVRLGFAIFTTKAPKLAKNRKGEATSPFPVPAAPA